MCGGNVATFVETGRYLLFPLYDVKVNNTLSPKESCGVCVNLCTLLPDYLLHRDNLVKPNFSIVPVIPVPNFLLLSSATE